MKNKICLFTAHSPNGGGGSTILRSLKDNIHECSITWYYLANSKVIGAENEYLGNGLMNSGFQSILPTWRMLLKEKCRIIDDIVARLLVVECDMYWIVSHNEGLRVAIELTKKQNIKPIHLTFHDDWAGALCARSKRFQFMAKAARNLTIEAIQNVASFDVVSWGMQQYYKKLGGRQGQICHRFISSGCIVDFLQNRDRQTNTLVVGHIGSIYDVSDFLIFLKTLIGFAQIVSKGLEFRIWGSHLKKDDIPTSYRKSVRLYPEIDEEKVLAELRKCDFLYAMYPMKKKFQCFSKTSLPTKITTYVKAARPILGHAPIDSTIAHFLSTTNTGVLWSNCNEQDAFKAFYKVCALHVKLHHWEFARKKYFGEKNLYTMQDAFSKLISFK